MKQLLLSATIFTFFFKAQSFPKHFQNASIDEKIVGGEPATIEDYPYQVALESYGSFYCGACILDPSTVITAAHCIYGQNIAAISVRAGSSYRGRGGQVIGAASAKMHPKYDHRHSDYDVAIIKLKSSFTEGSGINRIGLSGIEPPERTLCTVTGWGTLSSGGSLPSQLQRVDVPIVSRTNCRMAYAGSVITNRMICAGYIEGGKDACQGDSGGPMVTSGQLVGIVSWGRGCAFPGTPGVYTNLADSEISGFVREQMANNNG